MKEEEQKEGTGKASQKEGHPKVRYSDEELEYFKKIILEKIQKAEADLAILKEMLKHGTSNDTWEYYRTTKFFEENQEILTRSEITALIARLEKYIQHLKGALIRIENKTYGICRITGKLIPKERLELVPHATLSLEAKMLLASKKGVPPSQIGE